MWGKVSCLLRKQYDDRDLHTPSQTIISPRIALVFYVHIWAIIVYLGNIYVVKRQGKPVKCEMNKPQAVMEIFNHCGLISQTIDHRTIEGVRG